MHNVSARQRELSKRTGRPGSDAPTDDSGDLPPELLTIIQLDALETGSVSAAQAATIAHRDSELILRLIRICEVQVISWRQAVEDAAGGTDRELVKVCKGERKAWQRSVELLREALRLTVLPS